MKVGFGNDGVEIQCDGNEISASVATAQALINHDPRALDLQSSVVHEMVSYASSNYFYINHSSFLDRPTQKHHVGLI